LSVRIDGSKEHGGLEPDVPFSPSHNDAHDDQRRGGGCAGDEEVGDWGAASGLLN